MRSVLHLLARRLDVQTMQRTLFSGKVTLAQPCALPPCKVAPGLLQQSRGPRIHAFTCSASVATEVAGTSQPASTPAYTTIKPFKPRARVSELVVSKEKLDETVEVRGWVRTLRDQKQFCFVQVNDGSNLSGIQVVVEPSTTGHSLVVDGKLQTGASIRAVGQLVSSVGSKQAVEIKATEIELVGECDPETYPLQKKRHTLEFLRGLAHLRPRTNTIGAVMRIRNALAYATHQFFQQSGFVYVHTPIVSASDCEGAGEMFQVTTLLDKVVPPAAQPKAEEMDQLKAAVAAQGASIKELKAQADAPKAKLEAELQQLKALKQRLEAAEQATSRGNVPFTADGAIDYGQDFFGEKAFLAVSGQLNGEMYACALGNIYTFGPTFRAENSNTARHLAEFWMIEPEMTFADLSDDMACAEAYVKHCVGHILAHCQEDLAFCDAMVEKGLVQRLQDVLDKPFATITYTEGVDLLLKSGKKFEYPVSWGLDLQSEHERYLTEVVFNKTPLIVRDYPKQIKAFYMRQNEDGKTVAAMDMLVPKVGELIGGSQREERLPVLEARMRECGLRPEDYGAYLDLRRFGSVPHAGFGLGFERLVQFATGMDNIRDVIPFPRYPNSCKF